jgi:hypothetical protein
MYFKVALIISGILLFSGCSNPFSSAKPKNPKANSKNLGVKVVEEVSASDTKEQITTLKEDSVKESSHRPPKPKKIKHKLKPEPFSLESKEEDPELLGPQTTLNTPLARNDEDKEEEKSENNSTK